MLLMANELLEKKHSSQTKSRGYGLQGETFHLSMLRAARFSGRQLEASHFQFIGGRHMTCLLSTVGCLCETFLAEGRVAFRF